MIDRGDGAGEVLQLGGAAVELAPMVDDTRAAAAELLVAAAPHRAGEVATWPASTAAQPSSGRAPVTSASNARRWTAREGDRVIGYAALWCVLAAKFRIDLVVDPGARRRGLGSAVLDRILGAAAADGARSVQARVNGSDPDSLRFAARRGFVETMTMHHLALDLADARHDHRRGAIAAVERIGIRLETLAELSARRPDAVQRYIELVEAAREGWPREDPDLPGDPPAVVDWAAIVAAVERDHGAVLVALAGDELIGFCGRVGTAVRPAWRHCGVATALKVRAIDAAIARGETSMVTATGHPAMLHINEQLGFRHTASEVRLVRRMT